jgi:hypothetical protein
MADKTLEIADVHCTDQGLGTDQDLVVSFRDGRKIVTPLWWYPRLYHAAPEQRLRRGSRPEPAVVSTGRTSTRT